MQQVCWNLIHFSVDDEDSVDGNEGLPPGMLEPDPLSPKSSLRSIMQQEDIRVDFVHFLEASEQCSAKIAKGMVSNPPVLRSGSVVRSLFAKCNKVKITNDDIQEEVDFWKPPIICYVLGANPPLAVFEGFVRRMWSEKVERVGLLSYGIYIIRFQSIEYRDEVLRGGYIFFNRRPVVMKEWEPSINVKKEDIRMVPIWVHLDDLELKYWGERSLYKIIGQIGKPIMVDEATKNREKLIKQLISSQKVGLVGLLETRVKARNLGALYLRMFSGWCFTSNNAWHKGGRIIVSWNPNSFDVNIIKCTSQLIHLFVETVDKKFFLTFVYGFNDEIGRRSLWADLRDIASKEAWVVLGDFNDILNKEERICTKVKHKNSSEFRDCVDDCNLEDVKFVGSFFTWCNKQLGDERTYSKIDRVLANPSWLDDHPNAEVVFHNEGLLDHSPAVLTVSASLLGGKKPFRYFKMWSSHPEYNKLIRDR
uniref:DUF4283 domain-containing protein n=1 Tax=Cannabis sativa TaxID=3483 RepID=A0A803P1H3_CANSA